MQYVWVFNGANASFPAGIFNARGEAERWIADNRLSGTLTRYPLGVALYEWCIDQRLFEVTKEKQREPEFIQKFTCAGLEHYHYEGGV